MTKYASHPAPGPLGGAKVHKSVLFFLDAPALVLVGWTMVLACTTAHGAKKEKVREEVAVIDTNLGRITMRFFAQESPKTVEAFKKLARSGFFDGTLFHKVLPGLLIQGGDPQTRGGPTDADNVVVQTVAIETNELKHHLGTVSMHHPKDEPTSRNEFFICLQDVTYFDGKYTIIGEVISGLKVVEAISNVPRNEKQAPLFPVRMRKIHLEVQEFLKEVR